MSRKYNRYQQYTFDENGEPIPPPKRRRDPPTKEGLFAREPSAEDSANVIRGALVERLDASLESGPLHVTLWQTARPRGPAAEFLELVISLASARDREGLWRAFQRYGLDVFQSIAWDLAPEEFCEVPPCDGLIPAGGLERGGAARMAQAARVVAESRDRVA